MLRKVDEIAWYDKFMVSACVYYFVLKIAEHLVSLEI